MTVWQSKLLLFKKPLSGDRGNSLASKRISHFADTGKAWIVKRDTFDDVENVNYSPCLKRSLLRGQTLKPRIPQKLKIGTSLNKAYHPYLVFCLLRAICDSDPVIIFAHDLSWA
ncbi:hypothetical protein ACTXT7_000533 [Hymenolepis weldensis]